MSSLFSLLRSKCLQFELCNLIWCRTRPVTQPQEGRLTLRLLSRRSTLRQPPQLFSTCSSSVLSYFFPTLIHFSVCSHCLSFNPSLIPCYCLIVRKQTRLIALLAFVRWSWLSYVNAGSQRPQSRFTCGAFVSRTGKTSPTTPAPERAQSAQRDEQVRRKKKERGVGWAGKYQPLSGESRLTYSCSRGPLSDLSYIKTDS